MNEVYQARLDHYLAEERRLEAKARAIASLRVVAFLGLIVVPALVVWGGAPSATWGLFALSLVVFAALVIVHSSTYRQVAEARRGVALYQHGLLRLAGRFRDIPTTLAPPPDKHPFADDLDVLGKGSLLHRLDRCVTEAGRGQLSQWLLAAAEPWQADEADTITRRQQAVRELGEHAAIREALAVELAPDVDPRKFMQATQGAATLSAAPWMLAGVALPLAFAATFVVPAWSNYWAIPYVASIALSLAIANKLAALFTAGQLLPDLVRIEPLFRRLAAHPAKSPHLAELCARLGAAADALGRMSRVSGFAAARENEVFRLFIGPVVAWDVHVGLWLLRTVRGGQAALSDGFAALAEIEALASLGWFAAEEPRSSFPELGGAPAFVASQLAHPLLPADRRVANDVSIDGRGRLLLVTGSNMSGKSTLLRAMGLGLVLARAGAPIIATSARIGPLHLAASLRVRDDVGEGVSRFYAELAKLKVVLDAARASTDARAGFFLVDEILSGTNSRERWIGAKALLTALLDAGALGAASTHDLELHGLAETEPTRVDSRHFEEQVQCDELSFDYTLRPGPVTSSNALRLMRRVGLDVVAPD